MIREVPDDVVAAIDAKAKRAGLSRAEYLRRALARERAEQSGDVSAEDLRQFAKAFPDLDDPEIMGQAWK